MCMDGQSAFMSMQSVCMFFEEKIFVVLRKDDNNVDNHVNSEQLRQTKKKSNNAALLSVASVNNKNGTKLKICSLWLFN